ncbi:hypothetical protein [Salibacter halophilus]|uniref:Right-handed parallel beta-helix repeat-containing protein n=1 Tax=Salibacter halophilus TaxID=1803916 RepID=A0A6N6M9X9_9FLAO|nr:hypothetical protein [Salibacter halophilus]KAB1066042.1 hypothetical protein F3059_00820 [Salibacter halophilus]
MKQQLTLLFISIAILASWGCRKDTLDTSNDAVLQFSTDSVYFDTVFTEIGSATQRFMIYNPQSDPVKISNVQLENGSDSQFRFNVDGYPGSKARDITIQGKDSAFVFVEVTVDPTNQNAPLLVYDNLLFTTNGNIQNVTLTAYGQDAYYYRATQFIQGFPPLSFVSEYDDYFPIAQNITLPNDKPHVVFGYLVIDSLINLEVQPGTKIHFYDGAGLWAYRGSNLKVNGMPDDEVVFDGFRSDEFYGELPGQWDRIILNESPSDHEFHHAEIKDAFIGISAEYFFLDTDPQIPTNKLVLENTKIDNCNGLGLFSRFYNIEAKNCLFTNTRNQVVAAQGGGNIDFTHCTVGNYWGYETRQEPSMFLSNALVLGDGNGGEVTFVSDFNFTFQNSILYGSSEEELTIDTTHQNDGVFNINFDHSIIRAKDITEDKPEYFTECLINPDNGYVNPVFNIGEDDEFFTLYDSSVAVNYGDPSVTGIPPNDLAGNPRDNSPDAGCYEL